MYKLPYERQVETVIATKKDSTSDYLGRLGHNSSRTTEIYTHVGTKSLQKIKSHFDDL